MFQKFFRYSRRLEELQTARKAKEIDEIRKFDVQMEAQKQRNLDQHLKSERAQVEQHIRNLEHPAISEEAWMSGQMHYLQEIEEFDEHTQRSKTDAFNNDFVQLLELQESRLENIPEGSPALFSATYDVFVNEISDVTENELQREFQQNNEAIYENQERPSHSQSSMPEINPKEDKFETPVEKELTIEQEGGRNQARPSSGNVFYFRQISPPKK